eukprot:253516-Prorocentrum_minimum.AAC.1
MSGSDAMNECSAGFACGALQVGREEMCLWEERWIETTRQMNQWDVLADFAKGVDHVSLQIECLWRSGEWAALKENLLVRAQMEDSERLHIVKAYIALHEGHPQDCMQLCDAGMQVGTAKLDALCVVALRKWWQLPELGVAPHLGMLHSFQVGASKVLEKKKRKDYSMRMRATRRRMVLINKRKTQQSVTLRKCGATIVTPTMVARICEEVGTVVSCVCSSAPSASASPACASSSVLVEAQESARLLVDLHATTRTIAAMATPGFNEHALKEMEAKLDQKLEYKAKALSEYYHSPREAYTPSTAAATTEARGVCCVTELCRLSGCRPACE